MSTFYQRGAEKRRNSLEMRLREQEVGSVTVRPESPPKQEMEQEKRVRREIANSNERRRMQSINAGFQSLKMMIPHQDGEKLSKAAILQHTTDYIFRLETERRQLMTENSEMKQILRDLGQEQGDNLPPPKRKKRDTESSDEGIGMTCSESDDHTVEDTKKELFELRNLLEQERRRRMMLERRLYDDKDSQDDKDMVNPKWIKEESDVEAAQRVPRPTGSPSPAQAVTKNQQVTSPASTQENNGNLSLSRRNLDTIVEAIRHLEGDHVLVDRPECERSVPASCVCIPHSEESGTESSYDQEDCVSEGSMPGSESPSAPSSSPMDCETSVTTPMLFAASATVHLAPSHLLHSPPLLSNNLPSTHCSTFASTTSNAYPAPIQLLPHTTSSSTSNKNNPQLPTHVVHPHTNIVIMQKS